MMTLHRALELADMVTPAPAPATAHEALLVLRQALADASAMSVPELVDASRGYDRETQD